MTLDGITIDSIWSFICIGFALIGVFLVVATFIDQIRKWIKERKEKQALGKTDITKEVADKVVEQLMPQIDKKFESFETSFDKRFNDIDEKLASDKATLTLHTSQLNAHESRVSKLEGGTDTLCQGMLALLKQSAATSKTEKAMENYLITGEYNKEDWQ